MGKFSDRVLDGFALLALAGGALIGAVIVLGRDDWFLSALAVAYVGALFASLCLAALQTPALPIVETGSSREETWRRARKASLPRATAT